MGKQMTFSYKLEYRLNNVYAGNINLKLMCNNAFISSENNCHTDNSYLKVKLKNVDLVNLVEQIMAKDKNILNDIQEALLDRGIV